MKHLKTLACVAAIASLGLFTGCGGDDSSPGVSPSPTPGGGNNAPATVTGETITLDSGDVVTADTDSNYHATFGGINESGTYVYTKNGDTGTVALTPNDGSASTTLALTFNSGGKDGNYTLQETGATGTFTASP